MTSKRRSDVNRRSRKSWGRRRRRTGCEAHVAAGSAGSEGSAGGAGGGVNISDGLQPDADGDSEGTVDRDGRQGGRRKCWSRRGGGGGKGRSSSKRSGSIGRRKQFYTAAELRAPGPYPPSVAVAPARDVFGSRLVRTALRGLERSLPRGCRDGRSSHSERFVLVGDGTKRPRSYSSDTMMKVSFCWTIFASPLFV